MQLGNEGKLHRRPACGGYHGGKAAELILRQAQDDGGGKDTTVIDRRYRLRLHRRPACGGYHRARIRQGRPLLILSHFHDRNVGGSSIRIVEGLEFGDLPALFA